MTNINFAQCVLKNQYNYENVFAALSISINLDLMSIKYDVGFNSTLQK